MTTSLEEMLEKGNDYLKLDFKQIVNNMCYFMDGKFLITVTHHWNYLMTKWLFLDDELATQNQTTAENTEEELKYEIPKPVDEIEMAYVTMKDFIFDPDQQQAQVVWSF